MIDATTFIASLSATRDRLTKDESPGLTQLAAQVAMMEAALVTLANTSPDRDALLRWLDLTGAEAAHDSPAGRVIRAATRQLAKVHRQLVGLRSRRCAISTACS